jgi:Fic family protein
MLDNYGISHMIYATPGLEPLDESVLALISSQKERLRAYSSDISPRRWTGSLRRSMLARAIQGSNSIEGYNVSLDDAIAVVEDEPIVDERTETSRAIKGYRDALTYICQASQDPYFEFSKQFLKSLHFMMVGHDMSKLPGKWRPGAVFVVNSKSGETVYTAPDVSLVNDLVDELVLYLKNDKNEPAIVRGAMAHLNLTMIHPFKDGNGRMARALQTLVIALGGTVFPAFSSIEEWLGENTGEYYKVLALVGNGEWSPHRSAQPWLRFCLKAHYQQAETLIRRNEEYERLYEKVVVIATRHSIGERSLMSMFDAALGFRVTNQRYKTDADVSEVVASRDLKRLCDVGVFEPHGEKRGRYYKATKELLDARSASRLPRPLSDPYDLVSRREAEITSAQLDSEPRLPGV